MPYTGGFPRGTGLSEYRAQYDFAVDGGAQGTITIMDGALIPVGSIIMFGFVQVITAVLGSGASVAVQVEAANDIISAAAISGAPWSTTGLKSIVPVATGATMTKTTVARNVSVVITSADLTAGKFDVVLFATRVP